jgi:cobalt-zinc-cadmium resistance protein CzcA
MFNAIIKFSIRHRYAVIAMTFVLAVVGALTYRHLIIDAVPDITNVQVQINTEAEGYSPIEVEQRVTAPLEVLLAGMPSLHYTRSLSKYGLSQVTVVFKDGTDIYFARQLISQRLQEAKARLPDGVTPSMGPIATGLGEIFMFTVENDLSAPVARTLQELRELQDWVVRPQLMTIEGVVEVNSIGGASKQIVVAPNLDKLRAYEMTLDDLTRAITQSNSNVGAGFIESRGEQLLIRVPAQVEDYRELLNVVLGVHEGSPVRISDIGSVEIGSELRTGAATQDGREIVLGTVFMLIGENGLAVSDRVSRRIEEVQRSLPDGVVIKPVYNRADLVNATIGTVRTNLFEGAMLVIAVLFATLGNIRAAVLVALVIPLSMLITISGMVSGRVSANLMSLGALDFGLIVDGAVILVENCIKRIGEARARLQRALSTEERLSLVHSASVEVRQATMFGELIIMLVYIPILTLGGIEGKMYRPMAITVLLALAAAFLLSLTFVPAAVATFITGEGHRDGGGWMGTLQERYRRLVVELLKVPRKVIGIAAGVLVVSFILFLRLGSEFIPSLDEGDVALHALRIPGTSLSQSIDMQFHLEEALKGVPEVERVFAKIGTAEIATDPMPPSVADGFVILKPRSQWRDPTKPKADVVADIERAALPVPGNNFEFTQPIQMRFNELIAGVRSDVAVKIFGDDTAVLLSNAEKVASLLKTIPGASDVKVEPVTGLPFIEIKPLREKIARLGLNASTIQEVVRTAYAGQEASRFYEGSRSFPVVVRLPVEARSRVDSISVLPISLPPEVAHHHGPIEVGRTKLARESDGKSYVQLSEVADISLTQGPNQITHENGKRRVVVTANVRGRDLGSFVEEAQRTVLNSLKIPAGYWVRWGGQYENLLAAKGRLVFVAPLVLAGVFGVIVMTFRSALYSLLVFSGIPFALSGGALALWARGIPFSISAAVGFIALSGVSVLNGLVLVSFTRQLMADGASTVVAVVDGAVGRLRPVLMTALVASLGFLPMAISQGTGSEVQRPLATVVIGGIISATTLTLLVLPVLISVFAREKTR